MKNLLLVLMIGLALGMVSCKGDGDATEGTQSASGGAPSKQELKEAKIIEKMNILVGAFNGFSMRIGSDYDRYISAYGDNPDLYQDLGSSSMMSTADVADLDNLDAAISVDVLKDLNPLIKSYKEKGSALGKKIESLYQYYNMGDNAGDKNTRGKAEHKALLQAFYDFFEVDGQLNKRSNKIQSDMELAQLKRLKESGQTLRYLLGVSLNRSQNLIYLAQSNTPEKLSIDEIEKAYKETRSIYDEMTTYREKNSEEFGNTNGMERYYDTFQWYVKSGLNFANRLKSKKPLTTGEKMILNSGGNNVEGTIQNLLYNYNTLVGRYNDMMN